MAHSSMPLTYWDDAFNIAIFLINRPPTLIINDISPLRNCFIVNQLITL